MSEEIKTLESTPVELERESFKTHYIPFYTTDNKYWVSGCHWDSKEEALNSIAYVTDVKRVRLVKVALPVLMFDEDVILN